MVDVYLMETLMREQKADAQRRAALEQAFRELEQSRSRNGDTLVARLRRAVAGLLPIRPDEEPRRGGSHPGLGQGDRLGLRR